MEGCLPLEIDTKTLRVTTAREAPEFRCGRHLPDSCNRTEIAERIARKQFRAP